MEKEELEIQKLKIEIEQMKNRESERSSRNSFLVGFLPGALVSGLLFGGKN